VQRLIAWIIAAMAVSATGRQPWSLSGLRGHRAVAPEARQLELALVRHVIDGDTLEVERLGRIRLLGIDAPELGRGLESPEPFAFEARERLATLVTGRWVRLEYDRTRRDSYQRRLAYVFLQSGLFVNALIVRDGLARVSVRVPLRRLEELQRAERDAQLFRRGIWKHAQVPAQRYVLPRRRAAPPR